MFKLERDTRKAIDKLIKHLNEDVTPIFRLCQVPSVRGGATLDYILCIDGHFVAIEAKKTGAKMSPRQEATATAIRKAGGKVFVISDWEELSEFTEFVIKLAAN